MKKLLLQLIFLLLICGKIYPQIGGYTLSFDGVNDYVSVPHSSNLNFTSFTAEAWVCFTGSSGGKVLGKSASGSAVPGFNMGVEGNRTVTYEVFGSWSVNVKGTTDTNHTVTTGVWAHIAMTWSPGGYLKGYIDGVEVMSLSSASFTITNSNSFIIGMAPWGLNQGYFPGKIDEVRLWSVVRTQSEIKTTMFKELNGNETGLKAYYKMSNGSGSTLSDNQTNVTANNGSISGATWKTSGCFAGPKQTLSFDGTDDYVSMPASFGSAFNSLQHFSFCGWVYQTNLNTETWGTFFSIYNNSSPYGRVTFHQLPNVNSAGADDILISISQNTTTEYGEAYTNSNVLELNKWTHFAIVYDGTATGNNNRLKFYVNGREVALIFPYNIPSSFASSFDRYYLARHSNPDYFKGGKFDEFSFWNVSLSESQIRNGMMKSLVGNETGLFAYYRFDCKDGTTLYDITTNGHNGTLTNMNSATAWITSDVFNTWIGGESNAWSTASNWGRGIVPSSTDNIGIYKWGLGNDLSLSGTPTLNHIFFSSTSSPTLSSSFTVNGEIFLERDLDLNGNTITLGNTGYLNESTYRLYGTSGTITTTRTLSNISALNIGGLGATITTSANMGSTTITRGHTTQGSNSSISRYYDITPTTNTGLNATLVFSYNDNELNWNKESNLKLFKSTNGGTNWSVQSSSTVDTTNNTITQTGIDGFSRWTSADYNSPMPVELISFISSINNRSVILNWKTSKEINNKGFEIERKTRTGEWINVGYKNGKGTTNEETTYSFEDIKLNSGKYNYRLKQIDYNGNFTYHNLNSIVEVGIPAKFNLSQNYPNPFNPVTKIDFELPYDSKISIVVFDITGREVVSLINNEYRNAGYYTVNLDGRKLSSGIYLYKLNADKFFSVKRMVLLK